MTSSKIGFELRSDVAILSLCAPERLNSIDEEMVRELDGAFDRAVEKARAIVLRAEGRAFSVGANLSDDALKTGGGLQDAGELLERFVNPLICKLKALPVPWISAVRGPAVGIGSSFALAADLIVASENAYFLQAFSQIGLVPDGGATWLLTRSVGRARAMELMLLGERLPAALALEWGLINRVVPDEQLEEIVATLSQRLAKGPTRTFGAIRELSWSAADRSLEEMLEAERAAQKKAGQTSDAAEGITAFLAKRPPVFTGR